MDQLDATIEVLKKKIYQLKEQYVAQKIIIAKLEEENKGLHDRLDLEKARCEKVLEQHVQGQLSSQLFDKEGDKADLNKRIAQYLTKVDQCIAFVEGL
jgi:hypothetical protein